VIVENQILIASKVFRLISYDVGSEAYSYVDVQGLEDWRPEHRCIASSTEHLYLFEQDSILEMTMQSEVVDTIGIPIRYPGWYRSFTNEEGMIFLLDYDGKV